MPFSADDLDPNVQLFVFSIGSGGVDMEQILPSFCFSASCAQVINFDKLFKEDISSKVDNVQVKIYKQNVDDKLQNRLDNIINELLKAGKQVVWLENRSHVLQDNIIEMAKRYKQAMPMQFELIGGHFQDMPLLVYDAKAFADSPDNVRVNIGRMVDHWIKRNDNTLPTEHAYDVFTTQELQSWRDQFKEVGILYRNIQNIPLDELFVDRNNIRLQPIYGITQEQEQQRKAVLTAYEATPEKRFELLSKWIKENKYNDFADLLAKHPDMLHHKFQFGRTVAHLVIIENNSDNIMFLDCLQKQGVDWNAQDNNGYAPIKFCAFNAGPQVLDWMLNETAVIKDPDAIKTIQTSATEFGRQDKVKVLDSYNQKKPTQRL